jgi:hypothetical protein
MAPVQMCQPNHQQPEMLLLATAAIFLHVIAAIDVLTFSWQTG